tara:strand:- start:47 stop:487 length:441 start_codon:yes stop_codon:yes gene_type:complete
MGMGTVVLDSRNNIVYEQGWNTPAYDHKGDNGILSNNVAEYQALFRGLDVLSLKRSDGISELKIYGDSKLVIEQVQGNWKVKAVHLKKYRDSCVAQIKLYEKEGCKVSLEWIPREQNKLADRLAQNAADGMERHSNQLHDETDKEI